MTTYMREDGLGDWSVENIDGSHIEWRRRKALAEEAGIGTEYVVDISVDGAPPTVQIDFNATLDQHEELSFRVRQLKWPKTE